MPQNRADSGMIGPQQSFQHPPRILPEGFCFCGIVLLERAESHIVKTLRAEAAVLIRVEFFFEIKRSLIQRLRLNIFAAIAVPVGDCTMDVCLPSFVGAGVNSLLKNDLRDVMAALIVVEQPESV